MLTRRHNELTHVPSPGLSVVTASRLEPLLGRLADAMAADPLPPLQRETIVVAQNKGLRAWTVRALARRLGVAASLDLRSPRDLATTLAGQVVPEGRPADARAHPFEAAGLAWRIRDLLDALPPDPVYDRVRVYRERAAARGEAGLPLAVRLAELFDTYQVYRPDALAGWAEGRLPGGWPDEPWQADLWRRLLDSAPAFDRARHLTTLCDRLAADGLDVSVARVSVFGALVFPPLYWRVLGALARHVPVTVYAVAHGLPADPYAPSEGFAHPLLRDLAGRTRDWVTVLTDLGAPAVERIPHDAEPASALHRLQSALSADAPPTGAASCPASDRSVRVLACHSPLRELEVLRDEILDAFEHLDGLTPADVGVLVPDLATYAPLVDAVFGAESVGGARIPYHIAGHPLAPELRVLDAFHRLLALDGGRATATEIVGLLDVPALRRRAEIREDELGTLLEWVRQAHIHWGRDGDHKATFGLARDDVHTWRFGLDRLLLGVAVGPTDALVLDRLPVAEAGLDGADLLGRFAEWTTALFGRLDALRAARPPADWAAALVTLADDAFEPSTDAELAALVALRTALDGLRSLGDASVTFADVRQHLAGALAVPERHEPFLTGRVTVADPLALRHAPFRVLAVVGLGDAFPRTEARPDFDLLGAGPLPGDPDPHGADRQVFLDAVMAARERLVLSYVGRSHMDNSERAASVVLDSLLDTLGRTFADALDDTYPSLPVAQAVARRFVVEHPLQPFSPAYFHHASRESEAAPTHFTYAGHHAPPPPDIARRDGLRFFEAPTDLLLGDDSAEFSADDAPRVDTTLAELARAWTQPCRYHCQHLGLDLHLDDAALDDDEPVVLDGLAFHGVKALVLEGLRAGDDEDAIVARLVCSGRLPPGALGDVYVSRAFGAVREVASRIAAHGPTEPVAVVVPGGVWRLEGVVQASAEGVLRARPASVKGKDLIKGWIDHLAACATDTAQRTVVVGEGGASAFRVVPPAEARAVLQFMIRGMLLFREVPPPLFEKASYEHALTWQKHADVHWKQREGDRQDKRRQDFEQLVASEAPGWRPVRVGRSVAGDDGRPAPFVHKDARKRFDGPFEDFSDAKDEAVALCYRRREPLREMSVSFDRWARMLWSPLLVHREDA